MCFSSGEGVEALVKCYDISVSPQNVLEVPAEKVVFEACEGAEGSVPFSLCCPYSRAAAALLPSGVPRGLTWHRVANSAAAAPQCQDPFA